MMRNRLLAIAIYSAYLFCVTSFGPAYAEEKQNRLVFAHYMACCPFDGHDASVEALRHEIDLAKQAGIDGFAINIGSWLREPYYQAVSSRLFKAAAGTPFKLFFSADAATGLSAAEVIDMVSRFSSDQAYLRQSGKPVLSTYAGTFDWYQGIVSGLQARGLTIFFVPNAQRPPLRLSMPGQLIESPDRRTIEDLLTNLVMGQGLFYFGGGARYADVASSIRAGADASHAHAKLYMAPTIPYYRGLKQNFRVFESDGFRGMSEEWKAAIQSNADWVEIVTWNDWGEATYVRPFEGQVVIPLWNGHWGLLTAHDAYLHLSEYYIKWFKNREPPPIAINRIHIFYRPQSSKQCGLLASDRCPKGFSELRDQLHVVTETRDPVSLEVTFGQNKQIFEAAAGLNFFEVPLELGLTSIFAQSGGTDASWTTPIAYGSKQSYETIFNYYAASVQLK